MNPTQVTSFEDTQISTLCSYIEQAFSGNIGAATIQSPDNYETLKAEAQEWLGCGEDVTFGIMGEIDVTILG